MGKRELLLVVLFVIAGVIVYQVSAPATAGNAPSVSFSGVLENLRRHIRGNRATAEATTAGTHTIDPEVTELRVTGFLVELEVTGEDRRDVATTVHVESNGYDDAEARGYVTQTRLMADRAAGALLLHMEYPRGGSQRARLKVQVPRRLHVRVEPGPRRLTVTRVASVELEGTRGEAVLRHVAGPVDVSHRGGELQVEDVGALQFTGRIGSFKVAGVRGATAIRLDNGGEFTGSGLQGSVELESRDTAVVLDDLSRTAGPIRINASGGSMRLGGVRAETRVDGRHSRITLALAAPAPVAIYASDGAVEITPPPGGFTLDAIFTRAQVKSVDALKELGVEVGDARPDDQVRAAGRIRGGGPPLTLRITGGEFSLSTSADAPARR